ncbi:MAG: 50S ribosomal protein L4 [Anaerolineae bacterium]|jgi:large subunit ribosomal protein L4
MYNTKGKKVGEVELRPAIFEAPVNVSLMHQAFVRQMANARLGTHKTKSRSEINRTKAKFYRQKGTGRARHGSRNANLFVGGGIAHGPLPRKYTKKMPRKMRRAALRSALSAKVAEDQIVVVDDLAMEAPRTKEMVEILERLKLASNEASGRVLILLPGRNELVEKSARNLPWVKTLRASYLNVRDLLGYDHVLMPKGALEVIESILE